jgi:hypothetical protein
VGAIPRPNGQATPWNADAHLANGRYTMVVDVPDGVRCTVSFLPSHDTYSWDMVSLQGSVDSVFDAGCGGAPGGTASYRSRSCVSRLPSFRRRQSAMCSGLRSTPGDQSQPTGTAESAKSRPHS